MPTSTQLVVTRLKVNDARREAQRGDFELNQRAWLGLAAWPAPGREPGPFGKNS